MGAEPEGGASTSAASRDRVGSSSQPPLYSLAPSLLASVTSVLRGRVSVARNEVRLDLPKQTVLRATRPNPRHNGFK